MWEDPVALWRRLKLGREEFLQRLVTTLIVGGDPPPWNTPRRPSERGLTFLRSLHALAHPGDDRLGPPDDEALFVDECLLPKLEDDAANGWPDWAVFWAGRTWLIELKTERGSHRADQLPYYLLLASAAHPETAVDLTYVTGPLSKSGPELADRQRYGHVTWDHVAPLIGHVWQDDPEAARYVDVVGQIVTNLTALAPSQQREAVVGMAAEPGADLLELARATARDGEQRAVGASSAADLETLRDEARHAISALPSDDPTRNVLPWLWQAGRTDGTAKTPEGAEFGYELRFSRYQFVQVGD